MNMVKPLHIFLADDDRDDVDLFGDTLHIIEPAILFDWASDGLQALEFLRQHDAPDVIFLDLNMPMADGRKCLQAIKEDDRLKDVPVIMFTTSSFPTDVRECLSLGAICFITKPTDIIELRTVLRTVVDNAHSDIAGALKQLDTRVSIYYQ